MKNNIKALRESQKMTQQECADIFGVKLRAWQTYEQGISEPKFDMLFKIADYFNVSLDYLLGHETKEENPFLKLTKPFSDDKFIEIYSDLPDYAKMMFLEVMGKLSKAIPESEDDNDLAEQSNSRKCIVRRAGDIMDELHADEQADEKDGTGS